MDASTQFTAYMALLNLSRTIGQWLTSQLDGAITVEGAYALAALMQITPLILLGLIDSKQARRVLGSG